MLYPCSCCLSVGVIYPICSLNNLKTLHVRNNVCTFPSPPLFLPPSQRNTIEMFLFLHSLLRFQLYIHLYIHSIRSSIPHPKRHYLLIPKSTSIPVAISISQKLFCFHLQKLTAVASIFHHFVSTTNNNGIIEKFPFATIQIVVPLKKKKENEKAKHVLNL